MSDDKSKSQQWRENLQRGDKKLNKNRLKELLASQIIETRVEGKGQDKMTVIVGRNYLGKVVKLRNRKEDDALRDLATLNGYVVE